MVFFPKVPDWKSQTFGKSLKTFLKIHRPEWFSCVFLVVLNAFHQCLFKVITNHKIYNCCFIKVDLQKHSKEYKKTTVNIYKKTTKERVTSKYEQK
jgi:hypothetical protein